MINSYLAEFVQENPRVIIPGLGAFLTRYKTLDKTTFSPFLRYNDSLLEDYVAKKENLTKELASERVSQFVADIKKNISEKKIYYISRMGFFYEDAHGLIQFMRAADEFQAQQKHQELISDAAVKKQYQPIESIAPKRAFVDPTASQVGVYTPIGLVEQKGRELDAAKQSVENWMKTLEDRRGASPLTADEDTDDEMRREAKRIHDLKLQALHNAPRVPRENVPPPPVMPRRKSNKGLLWIFCIFTVSGIIAAALWFSEELSQMLYGESQSSTTAFAPYVPKISGLQRGVFYVAISAFPSLDDAKAFSIVLNGWGLQPEIVVTTDNDKKYTVVLYKSTSQYEAEKQLILLSQKYGEGWLFSY
ncbi:MAG: hypothetical protein ACRC3G_05915 [Bacteroidales bacterium]